jgi:thiosulfate/3-mercaptopyruvate sulfurtransferase
LTDNHDSLRSRHLVSPEDLAEQLKQSAPPVLIDIRFRPGGPDGRDEYLQGHIPGAVFVDLPTELAGKQQGFSGRRPLPGIADLERNARLWGIGEGSSVVVYDNNRGQQASRAWWLLRWAGVEDVRLLDGGFEAWQAEGLPVTTEVSSPEPGNISLQGGYLPVLDADQAADLPRDGILFDARDVQSYAGGPVTVGQEPTGHIPGAISASTAANLDEGGRFLSAEKLRDRFSALGADGKQVGVYCGGGVTATHQILALATIGVDAALFPGSWSAWSSDPSRPIRTGAEP